MVIAGKENWKGKKENCSVEYSGFVAISSHCWVKLIHSKFGLNIAGSACVEKYTKQRFSNFQLFACKSMNGFSKFLAN